MRVGPEGAVKGGRSPAERTLDGGRRTVELRLAECGSLRHSALEARDGPVQNQLFEAALGIAKPWYVQGVDFDAARKTLTISVDFRAVTPAKASSRHSRNAPPSF